MNRRERALCAAIIVTCFFLTSSQPVAYSDYLTEWYGSVPVLGYSVSSYPSPAAALSCVAGIARIFCVGGLNGTLQTTSSTYTAPLSKLGVGDWAKLADYPAGVAGQACVAYSGYIYCVGGLQVAGTSSSGPQTSSAAYFAHLTASGMGEWTRTTDYPFEVYDQSCVTSRGFIYCVGGIGSNSSAVSAVEYAQLSPSGIAEWRAAGSYPIKVSAESCSAYASTLYCVGGLNATSFAIDTVYSAALNGTEPTWTGDTAYITPVASQSCVVHYPGLYCVGGLNATSLASRFVFFSYINETHLDWIGSVSYPVDIQGQSCVTFSSQIYCVGGYDGVKVLKSVYFSSVGTAQPRLVTATSSLTTPPTTSQSTTVLATSTEGAIATTTAASIGHPAGGAFPYPLVLDLEIAGIACASVLAIVYWIPKKRRAHGESA